jgi:hypothetical protein
MTKKNCAIAIIYVEPSSNGVDLGRNTRIEGYIGTPAPERNSINSKITVGAYFFGSSTESTRVRMHTLNRNNVATVIPAYLSLRGLKHPSMSAK